MLALCDRMRGGSAGKRNAYSRPRSVGGGRSSRYEERRAAQHGGRSSSSSSYAPEWSDAAAISVMQQLQEGRRAAGERISAHVRRVLRSRASVNAVVAATKLVAHDKDTARAIMQLHMDRLHGSDATSMQSKVDAFLKPLRERTRIRKVYKLHVDRAAHGSTTFHSWLSKDWDQDRLRVSKLEGVLGARRERRAKEDNDVVIVLRIACGDARARWSRGRRGEEKFLGSNPRPRFYRGPRPRRHRKALSLGLGHALPFDGKCAPALGDLLGPGHRGRRGPPSRLE